MPVKYDWFTGDLVDVFVDIFVDVFVDILPAMRGMVVMRAMRGDERNEGNSDNGGGAIMVMVLMYLCPLQELFKIA